MFRSLRGIVSLAGGNVVAASGGAILAGRTSVKGSKEWEFCSNRGWCDEGKTTHGLMSKLLNF